MTLADHRDPAIRAAWLKAEDMRRWTSANHHQPEVEALNELGALLSDRGEHEHTLAVTDEVIALCGDPENGGSPECIREVTIARNSRVAALLGLGRDDEALRTATEVVTLLRKRDHPDLAGLTSRSLSRLVELRTERGLFDEALTAADEHLALARRSGDPEDIAVALNNRHAVLVRLRRLPDMVESARELIDAIRDVPGQERLLSQALNNLGGAYIDLGRPEEALEPLRAAVELDRRLGGGRQLRPLGNLGKALDELGRVEELVPVLAELVELRPDGYDFNDLAMRLLALGRLPEAMTATANGVAVFRASGDDPRGLALLLWSYAEVRLAAGVELAAALTAIDESIAWYEANGDDDDRGAIQTMRADLTAALDRPGGP